MRVTIAFDVDGTLATSNGPVQIERLRELRAAGAHIAIVSPSSARPDGFDVRLSQSGDRLANLMLVRNEFPADLYLYVSDNGDEATAQQAGFAFIESRHFA